MIVVLYNSMIMATDSKVKASSLVHPSPLKMQSYII